MAEPRTLETAPRQEWRIRRIAGQSDATCDVGCVMCCVLRSSEECADSHNFQSVGAVPILPSGGITMFDALAPSSSRELVCSAHTRAADGLSLRLAHWLRGCGRVDVSPGPVAR